MGSPLIKVKTQEKRCFEVDDLSTLKVSSNFLLKGNSARNPESILGRLSKQFINENRGILASYDVEAFSSFDGRDVTISFKTGTKIGAIPLLSPTSGKVDFGFIIKPRFQWSGIGPMLSYMGWKVIPKPLKLPIIPGTERKIPSWVLSSIILLRINNLLGKLDRNFQIKEDDLQAPKGHVNWQKYATKRIPNAKFLSVPCRFPSLENNNELLSAIHYTLRKQLAGLETQRVAGIMVIKLLELCQEMISKVNKYKPRFPNSRTLKSWYQMPLKSHVFSNGLQAIEWTVDDRGLAGIGDLQGLPWMMSMEEFFEAWIETIAEKLIRHIGGTIKVGRKRETINPLYWDPPFLGSQKYLLPDIVIQRGNETVIIDAKYKEHWEELNASNWYKMREEIKSRHRNDLLQVLAYSTMYNTEKITSILIYPCKKTTWESLNKKERLFHKASLYAGTRKIDLVLTAVPMDAGTDECVKQIADILF